MSQVSNLIKNHIQGILNKDKNYYLKKRPHDVNIIEGISGGFYSAIEKLKEEKEGNKSDTR